MNLDDLNRMDFQAIALWPRWARVALLSVLWGMMTMILGAIFWQTPFSQWQQARDREHELKQEFQGKYLLSAQLEQKQQHLQAQQQQMQHLLQILPSQHQLPQLLDDITFQATKNQLVITRVGWLKPKLQQDYVSLPLELQLQGSFIDFGHFLDGIANLPRIVSVERLEISEQESSLGFKLVAASYRLSAEEQP